MSTRTYPCLNCGAGIEMDDVQIQAAVMTMPEGCYCSECSDRLRAAPSFEAWADSEWHSQRQRWENTQS
jgi:hypothetical protein